MFKGLKMFKEEKLVLKSSEAQVRQLLKPIFHAFLSSAMLSPSKTASTQQSKQLRRAILESVWVFGVDSGHPSCRSPLHGRRLPKILRENKKK